MAYSPFAEPPFHNVVTREVNGGLAKGNMPRALTRIFAITYTRSAVKIHFFEPSSCSNGKTGWLKFIATADE